MLLTEPSRSVWENLDLGRFRSVLTTEVKILPYSPPARLIRAKYLNHIGSTFDGHKPQRFLIPSFFVALSWMKIILNQVSSRFVSFDRFLLKRIFSLPFVYWHFFVLFVQVIRLGEIFVGEFINWSFNIVSSKLYKYFTEDRNNALLHNVSPFYSSSFLQVAFGAIFEAFSYIPS